MLRRCVCRRALCRHLRSLHMRVTKTSSLPPPCGDPGLREWFKAGRSISVKLMVSIFVVLIIIFGFRLFHHSTST